MYRPRLYKKTIGKTSGYLSAVTSSQGKECMLHKFYWGGCIWIERIGWGLMELMAGSNCSWQECSVWLKWAQFDWVCKNKNDDGVSTLSPSFSSTKTTNKMLYRSLVCSNFCSPETNHSRWGTEPGGGRWATPGCWRSSWLRPRRRYLCSSPTEGRSLSWWSMAWDPSLRGRDEGQLCVEMAAS